MEATDSRATFDDQVAAYSFRQQKNICDAARFGQHME
jgi:hypothetical protein